VIFRHIPPYSAIVIPPYSVIFRYSGFSQSPIIILVYVYICKHLSLKDTFKYDSPYWSNKTAYEVENGLEGLTEKQTKLASYWNAPFKKICLGRNVGRGAENYIKWIVIEHQASSLFNVIANGTFTATNITKSKWKLLIKDSSLQEKCNKQGFNIHGGRHDRKMYVRIGLVANQQDHCESCNSCIGFGISITGCDGEVRRKSFGNIYVCGYTSRNDAAFAYILVQ
jgi:hypothetical protein